jgi:Cu(I)/Ag(I) efflux system membrane fusion protein
MNESRQNVESSAHEEPNVAPLGAAATPERPSRWQRAKFIFRAIEVRLRFIAVFVVIGLVMANWAWIENQWDRLTRPETLAAVVDATMEFYCPMHPTVVRTELDPDGTVPECPICGMRLSKRAKGEKMTLPAGVISRVQLTPESIQMAGVETAVASYLPLMKEVRTVGYIEYDESRLADIVTRVGGYLEKLYVDRTFQRVEAGEPLAEIYSPQLYSGVQELLLVERQGAEDLVASARRRLGLLGLGDREIDDLLQGASARSRLMVRSPQSGHVVEKNVVQGASVEAGATLLKVADLTTVWIEADVFERDLAFLREDQEVETRVDAMPGKVFAGHIALIYPELNVATRTNRVRIVLDNPDDILRPGMFATVLINAPMSETEPFRSQLATLDAPPATADDETLIAFQRTCPVTGLELGKMGPPVKVQVGDQTVFLCCTSCKQQIADDPDKYMVRLEQAPAGAVLTIPASAVIDTGRHKIVYVETEPGVFDGVEVELGPRAGEYYGVTAGLKPGAKVATAGSFLLDAETRLNPAAASAYFGAGHEH